MATLLSFSPAMKLRSLLFGCLLTALIAEAHPDVDERLKLIPLHNGMNVVNLDGSGLMATVAIARRDNFNAHSFEVTTIYATLKSSESEESEMKVIPVKREDGEELLNVKTGGGADCVLFDYRLLADPDHHSAVLITATRKFGASFADEQLVTFERYRLTRNQEGIPGNAVLYFKFEKRWESKKTFCDVNDAFQEELALPSAAKPAGR